MPRRDYSGNAVPTSITGAINATDLSITLTSATGWPSGGAAGKFYVTVDRGLSNEERILVASRTGNVLTIAGTGDRGVDDTSAASHGVGAVIEHTFSAVDADEANQHINDTGQDHHTQYLNNARHDVEARHQFGGALGTPSAPADIGTAAAVGTGDDPAREDHVHKIGAGAINDSGMFAANVVNAAAIAADAVGTSEIAPDSVTNVELATDAVITENIFIAAVTTAKIATDAVTTGKILNDAVTADKIADGAIDAAAKIVDGIITAAKIAQSALTAYTPSNVGVSVSGAGGFNEGRYIRIGNIVIGMIAINLGAAGNITADIELGVPLPALAGNVDGMMGIRGVNFGSGSRATGIGLIVPGTSKGVSFATIGTAIWGITSPWNWDPGDEINAFFFYETS